MHETTEFAGGVFSDAIQGGRAAARISIGDDAVIGTTAEGESFRIAYSDCQLELGGASGAMWFCRSTDRSLTLYTEALGFAQALQAHAPPDLSAKIAAIVAQARAQAQRTRLLWGALLLVAVAVLGGGYFLLRQAAQASVTILPRSWDEKLGELALKQVSLEGSVIEDPVLTRAVNAMVERMAPHAGGGFKYRVRIVEAPVVNAFALPGGAIVLYTGLLRAAATPEQVCGVLAHEMAHVERRHGMQRITQTVGVVATVQLLFGDVSGLAATAVEILQQGAINSYSREQEHEADMDAVRTLARSAIDPAALADFFVLLEKRQGNLPSVIAWLGTHPDLSQRVVDVRAQAKRTPLKHTTAFTFDWPEVQRHAGAVQDAPTKPASTKDAPSQDAAKAD